jgi:hypothetical protein
MDDRGVEAAFRVAAHQDRPALCRIKRGGRDQGYEGKRRKGTMILVAQHLGETYNEEGKLEAIDGWECLLCREIINTEIVMCFHLEWDHGIQIEKIYKAWSTPEYLLCDEDDIPV